jgi:hemin uptake protein HemP
MILRLGVNKRIGYMLPHDDLDSANSKQPPPDEGEAGAMQVPKIISFESLSRCGDEVWITCAGTIYRLRKTKQGKLLLTK